LNVFFDSSALAKRYVEEAGSDRVQDILSSALTDISVLCIPEIVSALARRREEGYLTVPAAREALFIDIEDMTVVNLTDQVIDGPSIFSGMAAGLPIHPYCIRRGVVCTAICSADERQRGCQGLRTSGERLPAG
jgi:hypothetical protein